MVDLRGALIRANLTGVLNPSVYLALSNRALFNSIHSFCNVYGISLLVTLCFRPSIFFA